MNALHFAAYDMAQKFLGAFLLASALGAQCVSIAAAKGTTVAAVVDKKVSDKIAEKIKGALETQFPNIAIDSIEPAPWPGMYEVVTANEIAYTNSDATLLLSGNILDTRTKEDLTAKRWSQLQAIDFQSLPFESAIKTVRGDGSRKLAVFADPDCPYCHQLEQTLLLVDNVTIYTFLYPIESLHPDARLRAVKIWCAKDQAKAWREWMLNKVEPVLTCEEETIAKLLKVGERLRISTTPTLFFVDGYRVPGAIDKEKLEDKFSQIERDLNPKSADVSRRGAETQR